MHAHHVFPQEFRSEFLKRGINVHTPEYGVWWHRTPHGRTAKEYNKMWRELLYERNPPLNKTQILESGREVMKSKFNINVKY